MAWTCTGKSNFELVNNLAKSGIIKSQRVKEAMLAIDRGDYTMHFPYEDGPQTIGYGVTISAPHMHGYALEYLQDYLKPGMRGLDVGSGSGYLTACMAEMIGPTGNVVGIDHIEELVAQSRVNVSKQHADWCNNGRVELVVGDGRLGYPAQAPYDCIHVGAASDQKPLALIDQLKQPGRLFVPVGTYSQHIMVYDKADDGTVTEKKVMGVRYVPLTDAGKQRGADHSY
ncbi:pcmt1 protein [Hesseltinella vesiculosa]|uniref:Protein-L-isoaspartate O-methyltransferase n=1 Tax=Hesseltinella vesiculosa TaxID=101127 RepID=A0A1X2GR90_9FUNG|nr:pcmt1 protein [Hesseltinella vesiculosa]